MYTWMISLSCCPKLGITSLKTCYFRLYVFCAKAAVRCLMRQNKSQMRHHSSPKEGAGSPKEVCISQHLLAQRVVLFKERYFGCTTGPILRPVVSSHVQWKQQHVPCCWKENRLTRRQSVYLQRSSFLKVSG